MSIAFALIFVNCTNAEEAAAAPSGSGDSEPEVPVLPETVKILAIGNSFSADAVEQELYGLFEAVGQKVVIGNMYIGGCPLETHAANAASDAAAYSYRKIVDGVMTKTSSVKLSTALADEDWTFVSVQEGKGFHGFYDTTYEGTTHSMEPDLTNLLNYVRSKCPDARLVYHAPWAAKEGYTGVKFSYYGYDQAKMYEMICGATKEVVAAHPEIGLVMNSMDAIQNVRTSYSATTLPATVGISTIRSAAIRQGACGSKRSWAGALSVMRIVRPRSRKPMRSFVRPRLTRRANILMWLPICSISKSLPAKTGTNRIPCWRSGISVVNERLPTAVVKHGRDRMNSESTDMTTNPVKEVISRPTKRGRVD